MLSNVPMVRAGDVLVVGVANHWSEAQSQAFADQMLEALPGVRVFLLEGVTGLATFRPEAQPSTATESK